MRARFLFPILLLSALIGAGPADAQQRVESPVPASSTQLILVLAESPESPYGTLRRFERAGEGEGWQPVGRPTAVTLGRNGLGVGIGLHDFDAGAMPRKREGDGKSPAGVFRLSSVFGFAPPGEAGDFDFPYVQVTDDLECVDDGDSDHYNHLVRRSEVSAVDWDSSERMREVGAAYETGIVVEHNWGDPRPGGGSCIFLHNWTGPEDTTAGCTAMAPPELTAIAQWIGSARDPVLVQLTRDLYERYGPVWGLPSLNNADRAMRVRATQPAVDSMFRAWAEREHLPGLSYGVVLDGDLVYSSGFGTANLARDLPVTPGSLFRIASMSKSITAMAILQLRDEGKLRLDDPISRYIPEADALELLTTDAPEITIRHLLTHSAGFPEDNPWGDRQLAESDAMLRGMLTEGVSFSNAPGVTYEYSNLGFALLGQIVEAVSGESLPAYTRAKIFEPLGMTSTVWEYERADADRLALGYAWLDQKWVHVPHEHHGSFGAMGGLITSIDDFAPYVALHLSAWPPRSEADTGPLRRSSLREMHQPWRFAALMPDFRYPNGRSCPSARAYGYGLRWQEDCAGRVFIGHSGGLPGFGSNWVMLPEFGLAVMSFDNRTYGGTSAVNLAVVDTILSLTDLAPRRLPVSDILERRKDQLVSLLPDWEGAESSGIFAENFFLDNRIEDLVSESEALFAAAGEITGAGELVARNQLRGSFPVYGTRGTVEVFFTLSPEREPLIQQVRLRALE